MKNEYHAKFVNLSHRTDRLAHMTEQIKKLPFPVERFEGIPWQSREWGQNYQRMFRRTPGACGCHESQVSIIREALAVNKNAVVFEDDCYFADDISNRLDYIETWMETHSWDVVWLGASFHVGPSWWHRNGHRERELDDCSCALERDAETTDDPRMIRTYGAFSTMSYIVNKDSIEKILGLFDQHLHTSIGIDWLFIKLQPQLKCFSFVPGCVRQIDNLSDIGNGMTMWSGFLQLNGTKENSAYVYQDKMEMFDPSNFDWKEAARR